MPLLAVRSLRFFPWLSIRGVRCAVLFFALLTLSVPARGQGAVRQADDRFLQQLTERRFFDLAQQHCRHQQQRVSDVAAKADWQLRLSQTCRQHAWFAEGDHRAGLLKQSLEQLTEFPANFGPPPEIEFQLRLTQVETLIHSLRMTLILSEAGHLFGRSIRGTETPSDQHRLRSLQRGTELTESLQKQLEDMRRDLDPVDVRIIRDAVRMLAAELLCLKFRLTHSNSAATLVSAEDAVRSALRTVTDPDQKHKCHWLLAELALHSAASDQFELRLAAAQRATSKDDLAVAEFLQIRQLLRQQEATAALALATETQGHTALQQQQLQWLTLEALLGVRELLGQLPETLPIQAADKDFQLQAIRVHQATAGVFHDAAQRTSQRYALVSEVGVEIADLIEQIDQHRQQGDTVVAQATIDLALNRLSSTGSKRAIAALSLRGAELLIDQQKWPDAATRLDTACQLFAELDMVAQHAVADLLRIFVLAQRWSSPADTSVSKADYIDALQAHRRQFRQQATAKQADEWLLQAIQLDDPLAAAEILLDNFEQAQKPVDRIASLENAGQLLAKSPSSSDDRHLNVMMRFHDAVRQLTDSPLAFPAESLAVVQLLDLNFEMTATEVNSADWPTLDRKIQTLSQTFAVVDRSAPAEIPAWASRRLLLLQAVTAARTAADSKRLTSLRQQLLERPAEWRQSDLLFLSECYDVENNHVGNVWLASTCEALVEQRLSAFEVDTTSVSELSDLLPPVVKAARVTGHLQLQRRLLDLVLSHDPDPHALATVASVLASASQPELPGANMDPQQFNTMKQFWTRVLHRQEEGSGLWLEATLQLATLSYAANDVVGARRQLLVVQTLYPEWGDAARRRRAAKLEAQLSP